MINVLIVLVAIIFIAQVVRIFELSNLLTKTKNEVSDRSNQINGILLLLAGIGLVVFFFWQRAQWMGQTLQTPASEHGEIVDRLWDTTMGLIIVAFLILTPMLFGIAFWYSGKKKNTASYITHNNKLEIFWTAIPAVILLALISYGLNVWGKIVNQDTSDAMVVEIYAKQFDWTVRYAGEDNQLGSANVRLVDLQQDAMNELGVISKTTKERQIKSIENQIQKLKEEIKKTNNPAEKEIKSQKIEKLINKKKIVNTYFLVTSDKQLKAAEDDIITKELRLPVGKKVLFKFRSQDVLHSAFLPHFRVQMNCVPGVTTQFAFTPTITTDSMQVLELERRKFQDLKDIADKLKIEYRWDGVLVDKAGEDKRKLIKEIIKSVKQTNNESEVRLFEYIMLCNKICGNAHYNMKMKVIVETEENYNKWLESQKINQISNL